MFALDGWRMFVGNGRTSAPAQGCPSMHVRLRVPKEAGGGTSSQRKLIHCSSDTESKQGGCSMGASEGENG